MRPTDRRRKRSLTSIPRISSPSRTGIKADGTAERCARAVFPLARGLSALVVTFGPDARHRSCLP